MAEKTTNYGLTKPSPEDFYDVNVQNENMDIIDENLKKVKDDSKSYTDEKFGKIPTPDVSGQINSHNTDESAHLNIRNSIDTHKSNKSNPHGVTAEQVGAVPLDGTKEMTGDLKIKKNNPTVTLEDTGDGTGSMQYNIDKVLLKNTTEDGTVVLEIHPSSEDLKTLLQLVIDNEYWYNLYGEHNKPTPAAIGASESGHGHDVDDITGTLPISKGGTGSTSATAALTNLGAAKNVHKHTATDINSGTFSSDRLPTIPITKGGTGAADSSKARENLGIKGEYFTFTLEDGSTVTKLVYVG